MPGKVLKHPKKSQTMPFDNLDAYFEKEDRALVGPVGSEVEIQALFSNGYQALNQGGNVDVSSSLPYLLVKSADVEVLGIAMNTRILAGGQEWLVREVQPDGTGMTRLPLHLKVR